LDRTLEEGQGWISGVDDGFAIRHPSNRLSMLYCRGRSSRQGHGSALLQAIESDAQRMGIKRLQTEASLLSRPMLERRGWMVIAPESFTIASVPFLRFKMNKSLC
jgi:GNAT superfamily N-acetyltransferase